MGQTLSRSGDGVCVRLKKGVMEDATIERLASRVPGVLEDLIELNNVELPAGTVEVPFEVHAMQAGYAVAKRA